MDAEIGKGASWISQPNLYTSPEPLIWSGPKVIRWWKERRRGGGPWWSPFRHAADPEWLWRITVGLGGTPMLMVETWSAGGRGPPMLIWTIDEELIRKLGDFRWQEEWWPSDEAWAQSDDEGMTQRLKQSDQGKPMENPTGIFPPTTHQMMSGRGDWSGYGLNFPAQSPLPLTCWHVAPERSTQDSPFLLLARLFGFPHWSSTIDPPCMLSNAKIQAVDEDEGAERGEMRDN